MQLQNNLKLVPRLNYVTIQFENHVTQCYRLRAGTYQIIITIIFFLVESKYI